MPGFHQKYDSSRDVAARKLAALLKYKISPGMAFESYTAFADAIGLSCRREYSDHSACSDRGLLGSSLGAGS